MSAIDVTRALPKRLLFTQGRWCLEVTRWHAIDRDIFNPINSYVSGSEPAVSYLHELSCAPDLIAQARDIFKTAPAPGVAYELEGDRWVLQTQLSDGQSPGAISGTASSEDNEQRLLHLKSIEERLKLIERQLADHRFSNNRTPSVRPVPDEENTQSNAS